MGFWSSDLGEIGFVGLRMTKKMNVEG